MELTYDPRYNVAYLRLAPAGKPAQVEAVRLSDEVVIDLAPDGTVYGIELLNANEQLGRGGIAKLLVVNESSGERTEVPLAVG